jgi:pilus assembly protein CpaE
MTTIIEQDSSLARMFQGAIGSGVTILETLDALRRHLEDKPDEYAVVLGPTVDLTAAAALAQTLRVSRPALSVILVRKRVDAGVLGDSLRAGIREVVEDRDLTGLGQAVRRAYTLWQAITTRTDDYGTTPTGQLLTVFSAKGGVGKSTLSTNLAAALVDEGNVRVCVVDLDLAFGDVALMLQLFPTQTIGDVIGLPQLDPAALEAMLTPHSEGLWTLAAPMQPDVKDRIPPALVGKLLGMLKTQFDFVIVDTCPAFDDFVLQAFDHSDLLLLIGTLDIPALKSLKVAGDTLDLLNLPRTHWRLVLNRADSKVGLTPAEVEKTLGMPITAAIPSSRDVPACINRGVMIVRDDPRHGVSESIRELARQFLGEHAGTVSSAKGQYAGRHSGAAGGKNGHNAEAKRGFLRRKARTA